MFLRCDIVLCYCPRIVEYSLYCWLVRVVPLVVLSSFIQNVVLMVRKDVVLQTSVRFLFQVLYGSKFSGDCTVIIRFPIVHEPTHQQLLLFWLDFLPSILPVNCRKDFNLGLDFTIVLLAEINSCF